MREREGVSQGVFARFLECEAEARRANGERGEKKPSGPSLKLLAIVRAKGLDAIT